MRLWPWRRERPVVLPSVKEMDALVAEHVAGTRYVKDGKVYEPDELPEVIDPDEDDE